MIQEFRSENSVVILRQEKFSLLISIGKEQMTMEFLNGIQKFKYEVYNIYTALLKI